MKKNNSNCPICNNNNFRTDNLSSYIIGLRNDWKVMRCNYCSHRKLNYSLESGEINVLYSNGYFTPTEISELSLTKISACYIDNEVILRKNKFLSTVTRLRNMTFANASFLDIGAATGEVVKIANEIGFNAEGVELSDYAIETAKEKNNIILQKKKINELSSDKYNIVHMNHVFEHLENPIEEIKNIRKIMKKNGILYIEIPLQFNLVDTTKGWHNKIRKFPPCEMTAHSIHHPHFYTKSGIQKLLTNNGYHIHRTELFSIARYNPKSLLDFAMAAIWLTLAMLGHGNYIEIFAEKR